jgi:hypothetical protein
MMMFLSVALLMQSVESGAYDFLGTDNWHSDSDHRRVMFSAHDLPGY